MRVQPEMIASNVGPSRTEIFLNINNGIVLLEDCGGVFEGGRTQFSMVQENPGSQFCSRYQVKTRRNPVADQKLVPAYVASALVDRNLMSMFFPKRTKRLCWVGARVKTFDILDQHPRLRAGAKSADRDGSASQGHYKSNDDCGHTHTRSLTQRQQSKKVYTIPPV